MWACNRSQNLSIVANVQDQNSWDRNHSWELQQRKTYLEHFSGELLHNHLTGKMDDSLLIRIRQETNNSNFRQYFCTIPSDQYGMLKLSCPATISSDSRPSIFPCNTLCFLHCKYRFCRIPSRYFNFIWNIFYKCRTSCLHDIQELVQLLPRPIMKFYCSWYYLCAKFFPMRTCSSQGNH